MCVWSNESKWLSELFVCLVSGFSFFFDFFFSDERTCDMTRNEKKHVAFSFACTQKFFNFNNNFGVEDRERERSKKKKMMIWLLKMLTRFWAGLVMTVCYFFVFSFSSFLSLLCWCFFFCVKNNFFADGSSKLLVCILSLVFFFFSFLFLLNRCL